MSLLANGVHNGERLHTLLESYVAGLSDNSVQRSVTLELSRGRGLIQSMNQWVQAQPCRLRALTFLFGTYMLHGYVCPHDGKSKNIFSGKRIL